MEEDLLDYIDRKVDSLRYQRESDTDWAYWDGYAAALEDLRRHIDRPVITINGRPIG